MKDIVFATGNAGKMREIRAILNDLPVRVLSMAEAGIRTDIVEDGTTFAENAVIKVKALRPFTDAVILADDSGLVVDALGGEPGVYSARYLGEDTPYSVKNAEIIRRVNESGLPRTARFTAVIAALLPDGTVLTTEGHMEGEIAREPAGANGFGYDPILWLPDYGCTSAELPPDEKNAISHRGKALRAMKTLLQERYFA